MDKHLPVISSSFLRPTPQEPSELKKFGWLMSFRTLAGYDLAAPCGLFGQNQLVRFGKSQTIFLALMEQSNLPGITEQDCRFQDHRFRPA
jgi:hypothetical protein